MTQAVPRRPIGTMHAATAAEQVRDVPTPIAALSARFGKQSDGFGLSSMEEYDTLASEGRCAREQLGIEVEAVGFTRVVGSKTPE